jgi:spore coat protein U-like protein
MKNVHTTIAKVVALLAIVSASGFAAAADGTTLGVTASVTGTCKFFGTPTLAFGTIDPSLVAANVPGSATVNYRCNTGTAATVGAASLTGTMVDTSVTGSSLPFTITLPAGAVTGSGFSANSSFTINGSITQLNAQNAMAAASYTASIALTISP